MQETAPAPTPQEQLANQQADHDALVELQMGGVSPEELESFQEMVEENKDSMASTTAEIGKAAVTQETSVANIGDAPLVSPNGNSGFPLTSESVGMAVDSETWQNEKR